MFEEIASSRFGFWIVASIIVVMDSWFLLRPGKFAYSVLSPEEVRIRVSPSPFLIKNKELVSSLFSFPLQFFFVSNIESSEEPTVIALLRLRRLSRKNAVFQLFGGCGIGLLALGPCLATFGGVQVSILVVFPLFYLLAVATSATLWTRRLSMGLSSGLALKLSAEIILCPILLVNIAKRISLAQKSELDTYRLALLSDAPEQTLAAIRENTRFHSGS